MSTTWEDERDTPRDPLVETSPGLYKFNLGRVPASVTPPHTWRRAAWFTIVSSASALIAVLYVASLVDPAPDRLNPVALPPPVGVPTTTTDPTGIGEATSAAGPTTPSGTDTSPAPTPGPTLDLTASRPTPGGDGRATTRPGTGTTPANPTRPSPSWSGGPAPTTAPPDVVITVVNSRGPARLDPGRAAPLAVAYLTGLADRAPRAAYDLTGGALRAAGFEEFVRRNAGLSSVTPLELRINRSFMTVVATSRFVLADGTVETRDQLLTFSDTEPLSIIKDVRAPDPNG